jgi:hypothetical protein
MLRGGETPPGLKVVKVNTTEPNPFTFVFEGSPVVVDMPIFEVPVEMYPLRLGDRFLAFPIIGGDASQRWGLLEKITGGIVFATMTGGSSCRVEGIGRDYGASDLIIPDYFAVSDATDYDSDSPEAGHDYLRITDIRPLSAGDKVSLYPTLDGGKIKYTILQWYKEG